jgi:hypothetical protein
MGEIRVGRSVRKSFFEKTEATGRITNVCLPNGEDGPTGTRPHALVA